MSLILSTSYDPSLLLTRRQILERAGYAVISASTRKSALRDCTSKAEFRLLIICHSVPLAEREQIISAFRRRFLAPVIFVEGVETVSEPMADFKVSPDPHALLAAVSKSLQKRRHTAAHG